MAFQDFVLQQLLAVGAMPDCDKYVRALATALASNQARKLAEDLGVAKAVVCEEAVAGAPGVSSSNYHSSCKAINLCPV